MSVLLTVNQISLAFGLEVLLDHTKLQINTDEKICLIGRNGSGKSSLLKIIDGSMSPDGGTIWRKPNLRVSRLAQELPHNQEQTVYEYVSQGMTHTGELLTRFHLLSQNLSESSSAQTLNELDTLQKTLDATNGWQFESEMQKILVRLQLDPDAKLTALSGGWQRRAALARALVSQPELLLLDEPTNHLDIEAIQWLEDELRTCKASLLFITHDRALLQRLATRIIELDRGHLSSWPGDYQQFLLHKAELLQAEAKENADFDKKLAEEEKWIRQGIKARRTRNEGRVRALEAMRIERSKRRELQGKVSANIQEAQQSGQLVIEASHITQQYQDQPIIKDFSIRIMRGDKIGLVGPNGSGKSTLLNLLLKKIPAQQGLITHGTRLDIGYFDQQRASLELEKTAIENVAEGSDFVEINGQRRHVLSYLGDFLFTPQRARTPVKALSGGECNRLLLARLFCRPSNLLVMDEPTNDLDIETLELLEELLNDYPGTLLLVSHDRQFLDDVVTSVLVFEGQGQITEYIGGYRDWIKKINKDLKNKPALPPAASFNETKDREKITSGPIHTSPKKRLSFLENKELQELPKKIESLEILQSDLQKSTSQNDFYQKNSEQKIKQTLEKLTQVNHELEALYQRWSFLEAKQ